MKNLLIFGVGVWVAKEFSSMDIVSAPAVPAS